MKLTGATHVRPSDIIAAARLDDGVNLLLLSTGEVAAAARSLPWVKSARVDRKLPGTVRVHVVERRPAMVLTLGAATWTLDSWGHVLAAGAVEPALPMLGGVEVDGVEPGGRVRAPEAADALRVWRSLPESLRRDVEAMFAPTTERISLTLVDGTQVRYGAAERLHAKSEVIRALRDRLAADGTTAGYIDVRVPASPAVAERAPAPRAPAPRAPAPQPSP